MIWSPIWSLRNIRWDRAVRHGACGHKEAQTIEYGYYERTGHTLTGGAIMGRWQIKRCPDCGKERLDTYP